MEYDFDDFLALSDEVERQGGAVLTEPCKGRVYTILLPNERGKPSEAKRSTCRCGHKSRIAVPYELAPDLAKERGTKYGLITMCAVCDDAGKMPRFRDVIDHERSF